LRTSPYPEIKSLHMILSIQLGLLKQHLNCLIIQYFDDLLIINHIHNVKERIFKLLPV